MKLLVELPWSKRARFHRRISQIAREMRGVPYCWPPRPYEAAVRIKFGAGLQPRRSIETRIVIDPAVPQRVIYRLPGEPSPEQLAALAEWKQRADERKAKLDAARQRLAALTNPLARAILDLHSEDERGECQGDDFDGYEAERPSWPCRTVEAVAEQNGIEL